MPTSQPFVDGAWSLLNEHGVLIIALVVGLWLLMRWRRTRRASRPGELHPNLQKYAGASEAETAERRAFAKGIVATSSTGQVAGYEVVRQIEAVFEDGHRSSAEAIEALKATAARRGANALINLQQERTSAGRCTARGDAVLLRPLIPPEAPKNVGAE